MFCNDSSVDMGTWRVRAPERMLIVDIMGVSAEKGRKVWGFCLFIQSEKLLGVIVVLQAVVIMVLGDEE